MVWKLFENQYRRIPVYRKFCDLLHRSPDQISEVQQIPFLPVDAFRWEQIMPEDVKPELVFGSSGTTGNETSFHCVSDAALYRMSILKGFEKAYGDPRNYRFLFLLPSYLERNNSSLVYMAQVLQQASGLKEDAFFLYNHESLHKACLQQHPNRKLFLLGVTFALLDFAEHFPCFLGDAIVAETGGMKGKRKEMTREEIHRILTVSLGCSIIHSEYGMTELLSQAWSKGNGIFEPPPWMKAIPRDPTDPLGISETGSTAALNIIDFSNLNSCCFLATSDLGKVYDNGSFEVIGRTDYSMQRGCNLLYS